MARSPPADFWVSQRRHADIHDHPAGTPFCSVSFNPSSMVFFAMAESLPNEMLAEIFENLTTDDLSQRYQKTPSLVKDEPQSSPQDTQLEVGSVSTYLP